MLKLHDKNNNYIADISENAIEYLVEEERNGLFELKVIYPATHENFDNLVKENILITDATNTLKNQKFRIYNIRKSYNNRIEVYARHISYDLLNDFVEKLEIENQSCEYCLNQLFKSSDYSKHYKGYSDIIQAQNYKVNKLNPLIAIAGQKGSILDTFGTGAELLRDNETIRVLNRRGHDNNIAIEYGENMTGFECEEDITNLITRIYPYAIKRNNDNTETIITLAEKYVDSSRINNYSHPYISSIDFTNKFDDGEEITSVKLKLLAEKYYIQNKCDIPKMNFKLNFVLLKEMPLNLCDVVTVKHRIYNVNTQAKVIKTVYNPRLSRYVNMELGEPKTSLGDLIGGGSTGSDGDDEQVKPPIIDDENFPDTLPQVPVLEGKVIGFASVDLSWTFENKVYYSYQLFSNKTGEEPNMFDLIYEGQGSAFLHQVKPNETWYYWVRGVNSYGKATDLSNKLEITTTKIDDFEAYFSSLAVEKLVVSMLSADYMEAGIIKGHWIDAKQLSVTDGNGKRTLDIDSFGNVNLDVTSLKIRSADVATEEVADEIAQEQVNKYKHEVNKEVGELDKTFNDMGEYLKNVYKDGVVTEAEKDGLRQQLLNLEKEKKDVLAQVIAIQKATELTGTVELSNLNNAEATFIAKHNKVVEIINAIINTENNIPEPPKPTPPPIVVVNKDIKIHYPHFSDKHSPAYPDVSVIEDYNGQVYLFDGGELKSSADVEDFLIRKGIKKVDKIFVTHSHSDHIEGLPYLIDKFGCKEIYLKTPNWGSMPEIELGEWKTKELHEKLIAKAREIGATIIELNSDRTITLSDKTDLMVFNSQNTNYTNYNNISLGFLFRFKYNSTSYKKYFIAGDMSIASESFVNGANIGKVDILKLGHHGNTGSNSEEWLGHLRPNYSIATIGYPQGSQVKKNSMRCKFVNSKVYLPNDNKNEMSIVINKDTGSISTLAREHIIKNEWYQRDNSDWYYFKDNGAFAKNETLIINNINYNFDSNGKCTNPNGRGKDE